MFLFDGENISSDASLYIYIGGTLVLDIYIYIVLYIVPIMIINRIYENQNLLSL